MDALMYKIVLLLLFVSFEVFADIELNIESCNSKQAVVKYNVKCNKKISSLIVYRSYVNISKFDYLDLYTYPITKTILPEKSYKSGINDTLLASNCTYYYYMKAVMDDSSVCSSPVVKCVIPEQKITVPVNGKAVIWVDKENYFLELRCGGAVVKRYPVSLGGNPFKRKLHYDCMSTPEGKYYISILKPNSDYHKSIGINYPNSVDRARYKKAIEEGTIPPVNGKVPDIGGSITIHGGGIGNNWTWGCMAMRNDDIDELFEVFKIKTGIPVLISGKEVSRDELFDSINLCN
ncbi:MAG: L,D-transpeptidase [Fibrobacter sp.]|nr:L,D-transpeptidase [Fibrobacter sp.]